AGGTVKEMKAKIGDKVSAGSLILTLRTGVGGAAPVAPLGGRGVAAPGTPVPVAATHAGGPGVECEMLVLGAGPGGYSAAFRSADLGMMTVLVERYPTLGGVCLNVGCIPSKALLHATAIMEEVKAMAVHGIAFAAPRIDMDKLRAHKDKVVGKLTGGLAGMAKARKVTVIQGFGKFLDPHHLDVTPRNGGEPKHRKVLKKINLGRVQTLKLSLVPPHTPPAVTPQPRA